MTHLVNDPAIFMEEMLEGFTTLYPQYVTAVSGGVVRSTESPSEKVAVVVGGGSGHYPAFYGVVGSGFADGAVVGNIFTSPSIQDAYNVGKAADNGGGILFITGNYAGDVLNFNQAAEKLKAEGHKVRNFYVTDDVASAPLSEFSKRRGIAGGFAVFKAASAAAEAGLDLEAVEKAAIHANNQMRTLGVAFDGCTFPGAPAPLFRVPEGKMGLGLGIHGEPGISEDALPTAHHLAEILVEGVLKELASSPIRRIAVILNGLGATKYEELFVTWKSVSKLLEEKGYVIVEPEVGELVTSLDMAGCSLTVMLLDEELERYWCAPCDSPAYRKGVAHHASAKKRQISAGQSNTKLSVNASPASKKYAEVTTTLLERIRQEIVDAETELGRIDAVAGDGDHGRGMVKGLSAAVEAANTAIKQGAGVSAVLSQAGDAWAAKAGGTSGVLWGSAISKGASLIEDSQIDISGKTIVDAITQSIFSIKEMGKAELGDKTMLDAMIPFANTLNTRYSEGDSLIAAWKIASDEAVKAALETASLKPKIGRARPLAEKSVGTPDAGATSFGIMAKAVSNFFDDAMKREK